MADADGIYSVLIVDDDPFIRQVLSDICRLDNVEIRTSSRMETAEQEINRRRFDLVITDVHLRGILEKEGLELLSYIKRQRPATKVLIMTGYATDKCRQAAYERGADYFIEKPFDLAEAGNILREIINETGSHRHP